MRRGLMGWNAEELPVAVLEARLDRLRTEMDGAGIDALVLYTNNVRPSAITYVTGFTPYWSDALLLVQQTGAPVLATALSKRVSEWIKTTDPVSEIVSTPRPGAPSALLRRGWIKPWPAGAYLLKARKRVYTLTPIRPRVRERVQPIGGLVKPTTRESS